MENKNCQLSEKVSKPQPVTIFDHLVSMGFETQFKTTEQGLVSLTTQKTYQSDEIKEVRYYRFNAESKPSKNLIVYTIEAKDGERGILVDGFGTYSDSRLNDFTL